MKALLLAAGRGTRFYPFDTHRAKPMFPVCNRPLLAWTVDHLVEIGLTDIGIVVGRMGGTVRSHFGNGDRYGCKITYIEQPEPAGTADAVTCAADFIGNDDVLIVFGDLFAPAKSLKQVVDSFGSAKTGVAATIDVDNISEHTKVTVDGNGALVDYVWKPRGGSGRALVGIYALSPEVVSDLNHVPEVLKAQFGIAPPRGKEIEAVVPISHREGRALVECRLSGSVLDLDYPWQPHTFGHRIAEGLGTDLEESRISPSASVHSSASIDGKVVVGDNATIHEGVYIKGPCWIGERTVITTGSHIAPHTMIGDDCVIGPYAKVSGFVGNDCRITYLGEFSGTMLDGGRVTHQIQLSGVFGLGAEIGAGTQCGTLRFDDGPIEVEVLGRRRPAPGFSGVLFGDYSRTGVGAMMMPGRIVGSCSMVGAGVVLMNNVPPNKALMVKQDTELVDWSPEIYNR